MAQQHRDPNAPNWAPGPADPGSGHAYGHGSDFGADVFALYRAGRIKFPAMAQNFSAMTTWAHDLTQEISYLYDSVGHEPALRRVQSIREELQVAMHHTTTALTLSGTALVTIAGEFLKTDEAADKEFDHLLATTPEDFGHHTPQVAPPPGPTDPYKNSYTPPPLDSGDPELDPAPVPDPLNPFNLPGLGAPAPAGPQHGWKV